jgi:hypothetical protein
MSYDQILQLKLASTKTGQIIPHDESLDIKMLHSNKTANTFTSAAWFG